MHNNSENLIIAKESFLVVLDSRNATRYDNGSFMSNVFFEFDDPIKVGVNTLLWGASVLNFSCPNSLYIINETNCLLSVLDGHQTIFNINFPFGNYNVTSFTTQFRASFSSLGGNADSNLFLNVNTITNIITIKGTLNFTILKSSTLGSIMGFDPNNSYSSTNLSLVLPFTCNFNGLQNLNVHMPSITTKNFNSFDGSSVSTTIQSIPIQCGSNQIYYNKSNDYNFTISTQILDSLTIQLKDDLGNFINLNNQHFNLTLVFQTLKNMDRFKNDTTLLHLVKYASHAGIGAYEA
jgi:hypothetical protein